MRAYSNLALIKYWGKKGTQKPINPSLSFSLANCFSETRIELNNSNTLKFFLDDREQKNFLPKIEVFFERFNKQFSLDIPKGLSIYSKNSFPHSAGIASSASGLAALSLALNESLSMNLKKNEISELARLGSGSACRSTQAGIAIWGKSNYFSEANDSYAHYIDINSIGSSFRNLGNLICIVSAKEKSISSTIGHNSMIDHPYRNNRIEQAHHNLKLCWDSMVNNDWVLFFNVIEEEALSLHALMMSSKHGFNLLTELSWKLIHQIRKLRSENHLVGFSIDAGPNIHLLYHPQEKEFILNKSKEWKKDLGIDFISSGLICE